MSTAIQDAKDARDRESDVFALDALLSDFGINHTVSVDWTTNSDDRHFRVSFYDPGSGHEVNFSFFGGGGFEVLGVGSAP